jgi:hypothetical protein
VTLVEFLLARLDEDEAVARAAWTPNWPDPLSWFVEEELVGRMDAEMDIEHFGSAGTKADARHIARHDPARVLAEVAAKRAILDKHRSLPRASLDYRKGQLHAYDMVLRLLALPYAGHHPDYQEEWKP